MAIKKVILVGGGGHALSLLEMLGDVSIIAGYVDIEPNNEMPIKYLGNDDFILNNFSPDKYEIHHAIVYNNDVNLTLRRKMIELYKQYDVHSFVAHTALVSQKSEVLSGCAIFERSVINRSFIGSNTIVNTGVIIEHDCKVENNVFLAPGVIIGGGVVVKDNTFIGSGTVIRDGVTICSNVVIGMGSIVTQDIAISGKYYGNPTKLIDYYG